MLIRQHVDVIEHYDISIDIDEDKYGNDDDNDDEHDEYDEYDDDDDDDDEEEEEEEEEEQEQEDEDDEDDEGDEDDEDDFDDGDDGDDGDIFVASPIIPFSARSQCRPPSPPGLRLVRRSLFPLRA